MLCERHAEQAGRMWKLHASHLHPRVNTALHPRADRLRGRASMACSCVWSYCALRKSTKGLLATSGGHMRATSLGCRYSRATGSMRSGIRIASSICHSAQQKRPHASVPDPDTWSYAPTLTLLPPLDLELQPDSARSRAENLVWNLPVADITTPWLCQTTRGSLINPTHRSPRAFKCSRASIPLTCGNVTRSLGASSGVAVEIRGREWQADFVKTSCQNQEAECWRAGFM